MEERKKRSKKEQESLLGYCHYTLINEQPVKWKFRQWNDRPIVKAKAKQLADTFLDGVRRFDEESMLKVPIKKSQLIEDKLEELAATKKKPFSELQIDGGPAEGLPHLTTVIKSNVTFLSPVGGQHRREAICILQSTIESLLTKKGKDITEKTELAKTQGLATKSGEGTMAEVERLKTDLGRLKREQQLGGTWLVALYDAGAL
jgi:hypothetical protein